MTATSTNAVGARSGVFPAPRQDTPATIWAIGDGAVGSTEARALAERAAAENPAAFLYLGDVYEAGTPAEFDQNYDQVYGALRGITLPTPGNHDWPNHAVGYNAYWSRAIGGTPRPYYAKSVAGWRLISLNSEIRHDGQSAQVRWLRRQLRSTGTCRLVFWHRPRFSASIHGDATDMGPLWAALRGRASLVLSGHEHNLQQFRPRNGITQLIAGAGGRRPFYPVNRDDGRLEWSNDRTIAGLRLTLRPGRARFAFITAGGRSLRSGGVTCMNSRE